MTTPSALPALMTQADYARHRKVSRQTVGKWKTAGNVVMTQNEDGRARVNVAQSDTNLAALQNPLKTTANDDPSFTAPQAPQEQAPQIDPNVIAARSARAAKETADAKLSILKYQQMAGNLVPRSEITGIVEAAGAMLQTTMKSQIRPLARNLSGCKTDREQQAVIRENFNSILHVFCESLQKLAEAAVPQEAAP